MCINALGSKKWRRICCEYGLTLFIYLTYLIVSQGTFIYLDHRYEHSLILHTPVLMSVSHVRSHENWIQFIAFALDTSSINDRATSMMPGIKIRCCLSRHFVDLKSRGKLLIDISYDITVSIKGIYIRPETYIERYTVRSCVHVFVSTYVTG